MLQKVRAIVQDYMLLKCGIRKQPVLCKILDALVRKSKAGDVQSAAFLFRLAGYMDEPKNGIRINANYLDGDETKQLQILKTCAERREATIPIKN